MLDAIPGVYRDGSVQFAQRPRGIPEETPVLVTFLESNRVDLASRGIDAADAAELRAGLATFAEDWDSPDMSAYDDYDAAKNAL